MSPDGDTRGGAGAELQRTRLRAAAVYAGLSLEQMWLPYFALGGTADLLEVEAFLSGLLPLPPVQRDLLAAAVNERLDPLHAAQRAPYSTGLRRQQPAGFLPAALQLLRESHRTPPERLAALTAGAAEQLGVEVALYVVDHEQSLLVPVPTAGVGDGAAAPPELAVDGTLPGQAFRLAETVASTAGTVARLWVPVLDGLERLGVLEVRLEDPLDVGDPDLCEQLEALATLVGHLILTSDARGDGLDAVRRRRPRTVAAELVWQLLPPTSGGTSTCTVSGWVLPAHAVGGDAFDYSLSEQSVSLAVFDAMGHGQVAGLAAATALSAYRAARRNGQDLLAQARAVDDAVAAGFGDGTFVTGVLAELDLRSGALSYLTAGHPPPLVLRAAQVVRRLDGALRPPFGLDLPATTTGTATGTATGTVTDTERLEPGDWLVLHTDGITEARDADGAFFGEARLRDLLEREAAAGHRPAETVRRITRAVLAHQDGQLQDDATLVLAAWTPT